MVVQANRRFFVVHSTSNYRTTASQLRQQKTQQIPSFRSLTWRDKYVVDGNQKSGDVKIPPWLMLKKHPGL